MLTPCQYHRRQMPDPYRKLVPMPPIVHPLKMPPTAPAMNGQMAFTAALSIPSQSMFSFMLFLFISLVVGWVWRFALFNWLLGRTCGTRKMSRTFDFQEENAGELRAWQISWTFQGEFESTKYAICTLKAALIISRRIACRKALQANFRKIAQSKALQANFKKPSSYASYASHSSVLAYVRPRESEIRFRLAWSTDKKKKPPAQRRRADEIYLKPQKKNAPFPTRQ